MRRCFGGEHSLAARSSSSDDEDDEIASLALGGRPLRFGGDLFITSTFSSFSAVVSMEGGIIEDRVVLRVPILLRNEYMMRLALD